MLKRIVKTLVIGWVMKRVLGSSSRSSRRPPPRRVS